MNRIGTNPIAITTAATSAEVNSGIDQSDASTNNTPVATINRDITCRKPICHAAREFKWLVDKSAFLTSPQHLAHRSIKPAGHAN